MSVCRSDRTCALKAFPVTWNVVLMIANVCTRRERDKARDAVGEHESKREKAEEDAVRLKEQLRVARQKIDTLSADKLTHTAAPTRLSMSASPETNAKMQKLEEQIEALQTELDDCKARLSNSKRRESDSRDELKRVRTRLLAGPAPMSASDSETPEGNAASVAADLYRQHHNKLGRAVAEALEALNGFHHAVNETSVDDEVVCVAMRARVSHLCALFHLQADLRWFEVPIVVCEPRLGVGSVRRCVCFISLLEEV